MKPSLSKQQITACTAPTPMMRQLMMWFVCTSVRKEKGKMRTVVESASVPTWRQLSGRSGLKAISPCSSIMAQVGHLPSQVMGSTIIAKELPWLSLTRKRSRLFAEGGTN